jgi:hypothetical protein
MKALGYVLEAVAIFAIIAVANVLIKQYSAQNALAQAELMKQSGYTNLEVNAGNAILSSIFDR